MGQATFNVDAVTLTSTWTGSGTPSKVSSVRSVAVSGIPSGASNIQGVLTYHTTSPLTGVTTLTINGKAATRGSSANYHDIDVGGNGTVNIEFVFRAGGDSDGGTSRITFRGPSDGQPMVLTVTWDGGSGGSSGGTASSWSVPSSVSVGSALKVTLDGASDGLYRWDVTMGSATIPWQTISYGSSSSSYTIPTSFAQQIPNSSSGTATVRMQRLTGDGGIASEDSRSITIIVPDTTAAKPTAGTLKLTINNGYGGKCMQNLSTVTASLSGYSGKYGASIVSVSIRGGGYSGNTNSLTTGVIQTSGNVTFTATVTDSRGKTNTASASLTVQAYAPPQIESASYFRANSSYVADSEGEYLAGRINFSWSQLSGTQLTLMVYTKTTASSGFLDGPVIDNPVSGDTIRIGGNFSIDQSYTVRYVLTDGIAEAQWDGTAPTAYAFAVFDKNNRCMSFGEYPEDEADHFKIASDWKFYTHGQEIMELIRQVVNENQPDEPDVNPLENLYPIGSIYISTTSNTSPASIFGGSWEQITGKFLLASSSSYRAGSSGGSASVTLTENQIPSHAHVTPYPAESSWANRTHLDQWTTPMVSGTMTQITTNGGKNGYWADFGTLKTGGGQSHTNMPPYLSVYMWQRVG